MKTNWIDIEILAKDRIRNMDGGFGWIPKAFIHKGHIQGMQKIEILLYLFLSIVSDRNGISFYGDKRICWLLGITAEELIRARQSLMQNGYIMYKRPVYQVLSLPE